MASNDIQTAEACGNCRFMVSPVQDWPECHRNAPHPGPGGKCQWPGVYYDAWCGEYEPETPAAAVAPDAVIVNEPGPRDDFMRTVEWKERKPYQTNPILTLSCGHRVEAAVTVGSSIRCNQCRDAAK